MIEAIKALLGSKKFITAVVGTAVAVAARYGFNLDPELVAAILGVFAVLIGAQGATDLGKEAAREMALKPEVSKLEIVKEKEIVRESGRVSIQLLAILASFFATLGVAISCRTVRDVGGPIADSIVDCTAANARTLTDQFAPTIDMLLAAAVDQQNGRVDWSTLRSAARTFGADAGMCVLANVVAAHLAPEKADPGAPKLSPLAIDREALVVDFKEVARSLHPGRRFKTSAGLL